MGSKKGKPQPLPGNLIPHDRRLGAEGAYHWSLPRPEHRSLGLVAEGRGEIRTGTELPSVDFESTASAVPPLGRGRKICTAAAARPPAAELNRREEEPETV
jgi:hypothetical protein